MDEGGERGHQLNAFQTCKLMPGGAIDSETEQKVVIMPCLANMRFAKDLSPDPLRRLSYIVIYTNGNLIL